MTPEQLAWFKYHPQTPTTAPKLEAVRAAEIECSLEINETMKAKCKLGEGYQRINEAMLAFAEVIDRECPECDDKQAALGLKDPGSRLNLLAPFWHWRQVRGGHGHPVEPGLSFGRSV